MIFLKSKLKRLRRESAPDAAFKAALRSRLVAAEPVVAHGFAMPAMRYAFAASALIPVIFFGITSYAYASTAVTEGDVLYPVKTNLENIEGNLKKSPEAQARFRAKILDRRTREIAHRLRNDEPLQPETVVALSQVMNVSVEELDELKADAGGRELAKTQVKLKITKSLTEFRSRVEVSNLPQPEKEKYLKAVDARLKRLERIPTTTAPLK